MIILFSSLSVFGQNNYNLPPLENYKKAEIGMKNFEKFNARNLVVLQDSISFLSNIDQVRLSLESVNYIRVKEGSKAKEGALIVGASTLIIVLSAILQVAADPNLELADNAAGLVVITTVGGTALGALIGSLIVRNKSYYVHALSSSN